MARSTLRREGWLPFFSAISIGRMIHAPSRPTSPECFHFPPLAPSLSSPRVALALAVVDRLSFRSTNSILAASYGAPLAIYPASAGGSICASILRDARAPTIPDNPRPPAFNITRSRAVFVPLSDTRVSAAPRMERPYQSLPTDRTYRGNYRDTKTARREWSPLRTLTYPDQMYRIPNEQLTRMSMMIASSSSDKG